MPRRRTLALSLADALASADTLPRDAAAVALALRYAALIDAAAPAAKYRAPLQALASLVTAYGDDKSREALDKVRDALAHHSVASDLGPKLHAVLQSLGMTLQGRGVKGGPIGAPSHAVPVQRPIDELRNRRQRPGINAS